MVWLVFSLACGVEVVGVTTGVDETLGEVGDLGSVRREAEAIVWRRPERRWRVLCRSWRASRRP